MSIGNSTGSNGIAPLRDENSNVHIANEEKADFLNKYFISVFTTNNGVIDLRRLPEQIAHTFTPELVLKHIRRSKSGIAVAVLMDFLLLFSYIYIIYIYIYIYI